MNKLAGIPTRRVTGFSDITDTEICYWFDKENDVWYLYLPSCGTANLSLHTVTENSDKTITVSPSILTKGSKGEVHGYLEHGVWRDA